MARRSLHVPGIGHSVPIPMGSRVGDVVFSSAIMGADPATGTWPADAAAQVELAFRNAAELVAQGGGTVEDIGLLTVYIDNEDVRRHIDGPWLHWFPDPQSRPARHVVVSPLRRGLLVQIQFVAVVGDAGEGATPA